MTTRADELVAATRALAETVDGECDERLVRALADAAGWGAHAVTAPHLPSGVSHGVPWGLSMVPGTREVRLFLEAQCEPPSATGYRAAAAAVTAVMVGHGADATRLQRWLAIVDADEHEGRATRIWHAAVFEPGHAPRWRAYVAIPPSDSPRLARTLLAEAGVEVDPSWLRAADRVSLVACDLDAAARVKAYVLMPDADASDVAALHDHARTAVAGDAETFVHALLGMIAPKVWWLVALGFTPGVARPETATLHFGVPRHLDDATAVPRIRAVLDAHGLPTRAWERARAAHHFVTFQRAAGRARVTTYFLPDAE